MRGKIAAVFAWVGATVASIVLATSAVSSVRSEVSDQPLPLQAGAVSVVTGLESPTTTSTQPTTGDTSGVTSAPGAGPTTSAATVTSTAPDATVTTSPTTSAAAGTTSTAPTTSTTSTTSTTFPATSTTTTTTAAPGGDYTKSYQLVGGTVRIRVSGQDVHLLGAVPAPGFTVEVEKDGPAEVEVEFKGDDHESKFRARVRNGELVVEKIEGD